MDLRSDFPFWTLKNGLLINYPPLEENVACDALVVGGGITGALVSHALVRAGVSCVLLDRRDIGHGSTSASTALLQYEIDTPLHKLIAKRGLSDATRAYQLGIEAIAELNTLCAGSGSFAKRPSLFLARHPKDIAFLRREFAARTEAKLPVQWLDKRQLSNEYGIPRPAAILSGEAAECDPFRLTHSLLADSVAKRGLRVFDRTTVTRYESGKQSTIAHTDRACKIRAKAVFFATGYETNQILPQDLLDLSSTYALVSEPMEDVSWWKNRTLLWETGDAYLYCRTTPENRILIGGADDKVLAPSRRDARIPQKVRTLLKRFKTIYPNCKIEPAFQWAGTFGGTKDGLAYIGKHPAFPNGYFALGFGGNGITFSTLAARILTNIFLGRKDPDANLFRFDR